MIPRRFVSTIIKPRYLAMATSTMATSAHTLAAPFNYPVVRRSETTEDFASQSKGTVSVPTPYAWLETPPSLSAETKMFVEAQGALSRAYLDQNSDRDKFKVALERNFDYEKRSLPALKRDGYYYYTYNSGLQPQSCIYRFLKQGMAKDDVGELFFDPNLLSDDGSVSRSSSAFSRNAHYFACALSRSGSDWTTIYIKPVAAASDSSQKLDSNGFLADEAIRFVKFSSIAWHGDDGFFYQRYPEKVEHGSATDDAAGTETGADVGATLCYHRVGTPQSQDIQVVPCDPAHPEYMFGASVTEDDRYVVLSTSKDTGRSNLLSVADLQGAEIGALKWTAIVDTWGTYYGDLSNDGTKFYLYTNADESTNYKISTYDLAAPEQGFTDLIAHDPHSLLSGASLCDNDKLVLTYSVDVKDALYLHDLKTGRRIQQIGANLIGSIDQISGRREDSEMFFSMSGFASPGTSYRVEFSAEDISPVLPVMYRTVTVDGISADDFVTEQVFFESKDGTKIPMFITSHKDAKRDGTAPVLQYGYGGFSHSMSPFFSPSMMTFIKHYRGVLAVVNLRGGGEYGEAWHLAGCKDRKQNVFDDFQYATKYLVDHGIGAKDKIAISGGSNGGLLVAACANQAPELYSAVIADVGVMDMLRFDRFTVGSFWRSDYGDPSIAEDFDFLFKYSPLENVPLPSSTPYPPTLLLTGDHDDRVSPLHSFKLCAQLQHNLPNNTNPLLLRVDFGTGHGAGKSTASKLEEAADKFGFVAQTMKLRWVD